MIEPRYKSDRVELYCADCLDVLPQLSGVDAVVTDPPYGIGFKYASHDDTEQGYGEWIWGVIEAAESKCSEGSPLFVWQAMLNVRSLAKWFPREWRIFAAIKNFVQMRPTAMQYAFDPVLVWWTPGKPWSAGTASRDYHIGNTANTMNRKAGEAKGHPCARPLDQIEHIIGQWVRPQGCILDPFMGSGTTGVAALRQGRKFVGVEIDEKYYAIAERRIRAEEAQGKFEFVEKANA